MQKERGTIIWGLLLLLLGGFFLALNFGLIGNLQANGWAFFFLAVSFAFLGIYLTSGWRNYGWLFPTFSTAAVAAVIWLAETNLPGQFLAALLLFSLALPFWMALLIDRHRNWWASIPGWTLVAVGLIVLLSNVVSGELIGALVMFFIGLPFMLVYLINRENWWALIPGGVLIFIGAIVLISNAVSGEIVGGLFMAAIGLVFLFIYFTNPRQWWAIIPGGANISIGLTAFLAGVHLPEGLENRILGGAFFAGLTVTFAVLWLLRHRYPTEWAIYPTAGLAAATVLLGVFGTRAELFWPVLMVMIGVWLLYRASRPRAHA